ncbi:MAG TPA: Gfo/Idh/MocA family oxidoreductase [Gemmatimonadales bacterium]|nr:Gfo/Idh/MocA family oxidoreductase [Gemmatimonadales bacterium]
MTAGPIRLAALGCGRVFERFHLPALRRSPAWVLAAAVDPSSERLRWMSGAAPGIALAASLAELDRRAEFDAVLVSAPPDAHCALASEALRRGVHVLIEKPMVLRASEAASLLELARTVGRQVWVGFNRRFRPAYLALRERLRLTPAERVRGIEFEMRGSARAWGAVTGYLGRGRGGDLLDDLGSHQLDLVPWIVGHRVEELRARLERVQPDAAEVAIDLRFDGGLEGRCRAAHAAPPVERLEVRLADRTLVASQGGLAGASWLPPSTARRYLSGRTALGSLARRLRGAPGHTVETFEAQLGAWAGALRGGSAGAAADGEAGARCVELVEACRQSLAVGGGWVAVRPAAAAPR